MPITRSPERTLIHGKSRSGTTQAEAPQVAKPSRYTPSVCVAVTTRPRKSAWRAVPRAPMR